MNIALVFSIIALSLVLIKAADIVVVALKRISRQSKTGVFALSAIILALGTSLPELFVSVTSAFENTPNLSLGVIIGSNIANIALIAALTALIAGKVLVHSDYIIHEVWVSFAAGILPIFLISDKELNRIDGFILIAVYLAYATSFFKKRFEQIGKEQQEERSYFYRLFRKFNHIEVVINREYGKLFLGIAVMLGSADLIVKMSSKLANSLGIPIFVIGLIVLAIGTSLPELAFSLKSLSDHEPSMFFGNLLGSTIVNSTLIIGITAIISPIKILAFDDYLLAVIAFVLVFGSFWFFVRSKHRLERWEAGILLLVYSTFLVLEFI